MSEEEEPMPQPARYMGREIRAPRKAGRPRIHTGEVPKKPIKEMTLEERRAYDASRQRKSKEKKSSTPAVPLVSKNGKVSRVRVFAPTQAEAEAVGGPDAIAMKLVKIGVPVELWERTKKTAWALRGHPTNLDTTAVVGMALEAIVSQLESQYNNGEPFDEEPPDTSPVKARNLRSRKKVKDG